MKPRKAAALSGRFLLAVALLLLAVPAATQPYSMQRDGDAVKLADARTQTEVWLMPSVGNIAYRMTVKGHDVLRWPHASLDAFKASPNATGVPFMGPWINRLDEQAFYANGTRYPFDMTLGNVRGAIPIHGFITTTDRWRLASASADGDSAWATSRLEFYTQPAWMKQWPFAHTIEMTYRLRAGVLEVATSITNLSTEPMPVSIGFHPYFQLTDSRREDWTISLGARTHWKLQPNKVPTGETEPLEQFLPDASSAALRDLDLDDAFSDLVRDARGRATMTLRGKAQRLDVEFGPNYKVAVVWAPKPSPGGPDRNFICFEPMAAMSNGLNMAPKGLYRELQSIQPGGTWRESFWIRPSGF
jgi:aldose 1-epimerase